MLHYFSSFCPQAKYLVKVDDDVFMQIPRLHTLLAGMNRSKLNRGKKLILGNVASGWAPSHEIDSKYYISPMQFNKTVFPAFVTGPSYVISTPAIPELLALAWDHPYISLEDVFITGILAEMANVPRRLVMEFRNNAARIPAKFLGCTLLRTISIHQVTPFEQKEMTILAQNPQCGPPKWAVICCVIIQYFSLSIYRSKRDQVQLSSSTSKARGPFKNANGTTRLYVPIVMQWWYWT